MCLESFLRFGQSSTQPKQVPGTVWDSRAQLPYSRTGHNCVAPDRRLEESRIWKILLVAKNTTFLLKHFELDTLYQLGYLV